MPVTGCSSSAGTCSVRRFGLLAVAERDPRLDVGDVTGALGLPARRDAQADADRVGAAAVDHVQQRGVGAVGADQRERERLA